MEILTFRENADIGGVFADAVSAEGMGRNDMSLSSLCAFARHSPRIVASMERRLGFFLKVLLATTVSSTLLRP